MINVTSILNSVADDFNCLPVNREVNFKLKRGQRSYPVGEDRAAVIIRERYSAITEYSVSFKGIKPAQLDLLKSINEQTRNGVYAFGFNDFSDNYVFPWSSGDGVSQRGVILPIEGTADQYIGCKVYTCGKQQAIEPIFYYPTEAEILINSEISSSSLDRNTGLFTSSVDLSGLDFQTDLYYKLVSFNSPLSYSVYYDSGVNTELLGSRDTTEADQLFTANCDLIQRQVNIPVNINRFELGDQTQTKLNFDQWVNDMTLKDSVRVDEFDHNDFLVRKLASNQRINRELSLASRTLPHKDLIYWLTIFKATGGTGAQIETV